MTSEELARLKKQMVIRLGTTTNDEASIISNMVDGGSAGALPAVSASDNGKVLTVANGAWAVGNASGGSGSLIIHMTSTVGEEQEVITTMDKTYVEIATAMASGQPAFVVQVNEEEGRIIYWFVYNIGDGEVRTITFNSSVSSSILVYDVESGSDYPVNVQSGK